MSKLKTKLAAENARAIKWKSKYRTLKERYERLKLKWTQLKEASAPPEAPRAPLEIGPDSKAFVSHCYRELLGREASPEELDHAEGFAAVLDSGLWTREQVMWAIIQSQEFKARHQQMEFVPAGHFYSAVPSATDRFRAMAKKISPAPSPIGLQPCSQARLLHSFLPYRDDFPFQRTATEGLRYYTDNASFNKMDAFVLCSMMRKFRPQRIVEIGSGFSSALMLDVRERFLSGATQLTMIEPYPALLRSLMRSGDASHLQVIERQVQDVDPTIFRSLQADDILFVDSTHVSKAGSDVNHIFFEILPMLKPGVVIHFHDIFHSFEYPREWISEGRAWNELYLLRAFLMHNPDYQILLANSYVCQRLSGWMARHYSELSRNPGGSFWMKKTANGLPRLS